MGGRFVFRNPEAKRRKYRSPADVGVSLPVSWTREGYINGAPYAQEPRGFESIPPAPARILQRELLRQLSQEVAER